MVGLEQRFIMKRNTKKYRDRTGATAVEFAFMVPIIFTMFMGAIEITRLNFIRQTASNACYEGARRAVTPGSSNAEAQTEALRVLTMVNAGNGATASVTSTADTVTVSVIVPVSQNSWGITKFAAGMNVVQSCRLSKESFSQ